MSRLGCTLSDFCAPIKCVCTRVSTIMSSMVLYKTETILFRLLCVSSLLSVFFSRGRKSWRDFDRGVYCVAKFF